MRVGKQFVLTALAAIGIAAQLGAQTPSGILDWTALPDLPHPQWGHFVGVHDGVLLVAGGVRNGAGGGDAGGRTWLNDVYLLEQGSPAWRKAGELKEPVALGAAVSTNQGVILLGGGTGAGYTTQVTRLSLAGGTLTERDLPPLPEPCAFPSAALLDGNVFVAGGHAAPDAPAPQKNFWKFDLSDAEGSWQPLEPWPGPERMEAHLSAQSGALYLFGGRRTANGPREGTEPLLDGYRYVPDLGWTAVAPLPGALAGGAVLPVGQSHLYALGGELSASGTALGVGREVWAYHTLTDTWSDRGAMVSGPRPSGAAIWEGSIVVAGGEASPGVGGATVSRGDLVARGGRLGVLNGAIMVFYFAGLIAMGLYFARREQSPDNYFLGGRRIPWWAMGLSVFGTQLSAITFLAIPARAYATDWVYMWANAGIVLIAPFVVYGVLPHYRKGRFTTAYDYLEQRFNVAARLYGASVFLLFQAGRVGIVLFLPAMALHAVTGLDVYACILAMGLLATLYTVLGGLEAVIWTDVAQVVVLGLGVAVSLVVVVAQLEGGVGELIAVASDAHKFHAFNWTWDMSTTAVWVCLVGNVFAVAYPYTADQTIVQRYLATASEKDAAKAIWTNALLSIPATFLFFSMGTALFVFFRARPDLLDPALKNDAIFPLFIVGQLPAGLSGLVIAAVFAAAMSSLDSSMNSVSAVIVTDFYGRFRRDLSDGHRLWAARLVTCGFGVLGTGAALLMAAQDIQSIFEQYNRILGLTGGGLAGLLALGMSTRRANGAGALMGAAASAAAVYAVSNYTSVHLFLYGAVGFCTSYAVGYAASHAFPTAPAPLNKTAIKPS